MRHSKAQEWFSQARKWSGLKKEDAWLPNFSDWWKQEHRDLPNSDGEWKNAANAYVEEWAANLAKGPAGIRLTAGGGPEMAVSSRILFECEKADRYALVIEQGDTKLSLNDKRIIYFRTRASANSKLKFENCAIDTLCLDGPVSIEMKQSWIRVLEITETAKIRGFSIDGGGIETISCPRPGRENPFVGSVSLRGARFSSDPKNAQPYRDVRHHLNTIHNYQAASYFHAAEMAASWKTQGRVDKFANYIYWAGSDYGTSTGWPLAWFLLFTVANFLILFFMNGVTVVGAEADNFGWREALAPENEFAVALRAIVLTFSQVLNPLGVFGPKSLVVAKTVALEAANLSLSFFATLALALSLLAIRRRFRLDKGE